MENYGETVSIYHLINGGGYECVTHYDSGDRETVYVHRLMAAAYYGFDAIKGEHVHHKNGVQWDNRPSNIEVKGVREHPRHHAEERSRDEKGRFLPAGDAPEVF